MGSNEIRLRKQRLNPGNISRHRNYAELMRRHRRGLKTRQLLLVVIYIVIVLVLLLLSYIAIRVEKAREGKNARVEFLHSQLLL
jgi:competence protein ComGC